MRDHKKKSPGTRSVTPTREMNAWRHAPIEDVDCVVAQRKVKKESLQRQQHKRNILRQIHELRCSLAFEGMEDSPEHVRSPSPGTGKWLQDCEPYRTWLGSTESPSYGRLLWIKGKPGSGKSTVMKLIAMNVVQEEPGTVFGSFSFFSSDEKAPGLRNTVLGLYRALCHQILPYVSDTLVETLYKTRSLQKLAPSNDWHCDTLENWLLSIPDQSQSFAQSVLKICILVDGIDDCQGERPRNMLKFFGSLAAAAAHGQVTLNIALSGQALSATTMPPGLSQEEIVVDECNGDDIRQYVSKEMSCLRSASVHWDDGAEWKILETRIIEAAAGVFLWVRLILENIAEELDKGRTVKSLDRELQEVPPDLESLYSHILRKADGDRSFRFFQWAVYSSRSLQVREWSEILAFIYDPSDQALVNWQDSPNFVDYEVDWEEEAQLGGQWAELRSENLRRLRQKGEVLRKRIRSLSCGLVDLQGHDHDTLERNVGQASQSASTATAGSFGHGEAFQFIHPSVRRFFLSGKGFASISAGEKEAGRGKGHMFILESCVTFANSPVLRRFIEAREARKKQRLTASTRISSTYSMDDASEHPPRRRRVLKRWGSVVSFSSSAASCQGRPVQAHPVQAEKRLRLRVKKSRQTNRIRTLDERKLNKLSNMSAHVVRRIRIEHYLLSMEPTVPKHPSIFPPRGGCSDGTVNNPKAVIQRVRASSAASFTFGTSVPCDASDEHNTEALRKTLRRPASLPTLPIRSILPVEYAPTPTAYTGKTRELERFPALYTYMVNMFEFHALAAEQQHADPAPLVKRLLDGQTWDRWCLLRDQSSGRSLLQFAFDKGLLSWIDAIINLDRAADKHEVSRTMIDATLVKHPASESQIEWLLERPFWKMRDTSGWNILHYACWTSNFTIIETILRRLRSSDEEDRALGSGEQPDAGTQIHRNKSEVMRMATQEERLGNTPLHFLVENSATTSGVLQDYIDYFGSNDNPDRLGRTPLGIACHTSGWSICRLLLDKGADPNKLFGAQVTSWLPVKEICEGSVRLELLKPKLTASNLEKVERIKSKKRADSVDAEKHEDKTS